MGELSELGAWDPERAVKLSPEDYPTWQAAIAVPEGGAFEWKCVKRGDGEPVWQTGENNRYPGSGATASGSF